MSITPAPASPAPLALRRLQNLLRAANAAHSAMLAVERYHRALTPASRADACDSALFWLEQAAFWLGGREPEPGPPQRANPRCPSAAAPTCDRRSASAPDRRRFRRRGLTAAPPHPHRMDGKR